MATSWWLSAKKLPANAGDMGTIPGSGKSPGRRKFPSIPAWEIPWIDEPGGLRSMSSQKI